MILIIAEDGSLIHDNCGGEIGRKRLPGTNVQYLFCRSCNKGVMGNPVKLTLEGTVVKTTLEPEPRRVLH